MSRASEFCASIQTPVELKQAEKDEEFAAQRAYSLLLSLFGSNISDVDIESRVGGC